MSCMPDDQHTQTEHISISGDNSGAIIQAGTAIGSFHLPTQKEDHKDLRRLAEKVRVLVYQFESLAPDHPELRQLAERLEEVHQAVVDLHSPHIARLRQRPGLPHTA